MTIPGAGGQVPARIDQQGLGPQPVPVSPGGKPILRVTQIIVSGANQGIYTYSGTPAAGNLIETAGISPSTTTDQFGNHVLPGHSSYASGFATSMTAGVINWYTGSLAAGWTFYGDISISLVSNLVVLNFSSVGGAINTPQNSGAGVVLPLTLPPPATYQTLYIGDMAAAVNDIFSALEAANILSG